MTRIVKLGPPYLGKVTRTSLQDQPTGSFLDCRDFLPFDGKTDRTRLSVRPGFAALGGTRAGLAMLHTMPKASAAYGAVLMGCSSTDLYEWDGVSTWTSVGTINTSASRAIHAAHYGLTLYIASNISAGDYDKYSVAGGLQDWDATVGTIPQDCILICEWGSRIVLSGGVTEPHVVYMSRVDDPEDWNYGETDTGAPIASPTAGAIRAIIPHNRECLIAGFHNGMQIFRGNPTKGGSLEWLSHIVGPISGKAWCKSPQDITYILSHDGLYRIMPGCGAPPESISRELIPDSLIGLDGVSHQAYLGYDERFNVIHIYVEHSSLSQRWLYDVKGGGFWPITSPGSSIYAVHRYGPADSSTASGTAIAMSTNVVRFDNATALGGSDEAYAKWLVELEDEGKSARISKANFVFGSNTTDTTGTVTFYGGENAYDASQAGTSRKAQVTIATLQANHGNTRPRVGGQSALIHLAQTDSAQHISLEGATLSVDSTGVEKG
jgi:hypothetical protein